MSDWTHVAGVIRIDHLPLLDVLSPQQVEKIVKDDAPIGSEGGLDFHIVKTQILTKLGGPLVWGSITFVGDLRDFNIEDVEKVKTWLDGLLQKFDEQAIMVRQGIVLIELEPKEIPITLRFDQETRTWR